MRLELNMHRRRTLVAIIGLGLASSIATPADAVTCSISPQSVNFGNYDTLSGQQLDGVGTISVNCDATATFTISLSSGAGSFNARQLSSGSNSLGYNLYTDASRLSVWGDGTGSTTTVSESATSGNFTVYGRIPADQNVPAGTYSDTVTVTITY